MIAMKVADEYVIDPAETYPGFPELHLGTFSAVDQKKALVYI
jgi:hypothetical protein